MACFGFSLLQETLLFCLMPLTECCVALKEVNREGALASLRSGDMTKLLTEVQSITGSDDKFSAKSFLDKQKESTVPTSRTTDSSTVKRELSSSPASSTTRLLPAEPAPGTPMASEGGRSSQSSGKKVKLWDKERAVDDEKMRVTRVFSALRESVESAVNDGNLALLAAKELTQTQPSVYQPRLQVLEHRMKCLLAIVAGPQERAWAHAMQGT